MSYFVVMMLRSGKNFPLHNVLAMEQRWILVDLPCRWLISDFSLGGARICNFLVQQFGNLIPKIQRTPTYPSFRVRSIELSD